MMLQRDALVIAIKLDSPQFVPVSGMTLETLEQAVFYPPSKEREFFFSSQKEKDTFRVSLGKAAGQGTQVLTMRSWFSLFSGRRLLLSGKAFFARWFY